MFKSVYELKSVLQLAHETNNKVLEPTAAPPRHIVDIILHVETIDVKSLKLV